MTKWVPSCTYNISRGPNEYQVEWYTRITKWVPSLRTFQGNQMGTKFKNISRGPNGNQVEWYTRMTKCVPSCILFQVDRVGTNWIIFQFGQLFFRYQLKNISGGPGGHQVHSQTHCWSQQSSHRNEQIQCSHYYTM